MDGEFYPGVYGIAAFATSFEFAIRTTGESDGLCGANLNLVAGTSGQILERNGEVVTTNIHFPVNFHYSISLNVRDPEPAVYQDVYFTGPSGSGINHVQANWGSGGSSHFSYGSPVFDIPPYPASGEYHASYRGHPFVQYINTDVLQNTSFVAVPVFNLSSGIITSLELTHRHSQTGAIVSIDDLFDHAHITLNLNTGGNVTRHFSVGNLTIDLSDLSISWDSIEHNIFINYSNRDLTLYTNYQIPGDHHTWAGYPIRSDGKAFTGSLMGWIYVIQQPWIYNFDLGGWFFTYPHFIREEGAWIWVINQSGIASSPSEGWSPWPQVAQSTWVNTGHFLQRIDTRHSPTIWSEALSSWIYVSTETLTESGAWVFVYKMNP